MADDELSDSHPDSSSLHGTEKLWVVWPLPRKWMLSPSGENPISTFAYLKTEFLMGLDLTFSEDS